MDSHGFLFNLVVYLSAAVIAVPLFARIGLGSVLGYLAAGVCIGPWGLGLIKNVGDILHFSEIGVVLLLFLIGLELEPRKLWTMRRPILGVGGTQVLVTAGLLFPLGMWLGLRWQTALVAALGLALSSTAIALQSLKEKNLLNTPAGRTGFSVLLFQDIAVIPIIALIPLLGFGAQAAGDGGGNQSALMIIGVIGAILVVGRFFLRHIFAFVAATRLREVFTALSLLLVSGIAAIMDMLGISMALGAFLAGVLLANSEYRHALESDIEPFKGLLLGLFFISVGMSVNFGLLLENPLLIFALTAALVALKAAVLFVIARASGIGAHQRGVFSFTLAQGGEFGFVLFGFAVTAGAMEVQVANQLTLAVALSMASTPLLLIVDEKLIAPRFFRAGLIGGDGDGEGDMDDIADNQNPVIIVGFGRFGQVVGRMLMANKITPTLIDNNPEQLERVRRFGYKSYYGDALRLDVLRSAGAAQAKLIVLSMADRETINQAIELIRREFPNLKIFARAYDRGHAMHLIDNRVDGFSRETFASALELAKDALMEFGFTSWQAQRLSETFRQFDIDTLQQQVAVRHDEKALISIARTARTNIEETFAADKDKGEEG